jgi:hypothetical protein
MYFKFKISIHIERNFFCDNYLDGPIRLTSVRGICGEPTASRPCRRRRLLRRSIDFGGDGRVGEI